MMPSDPFDHLTRRKLAALRSSRMLSPDKALQDDISNLLAMAGETGLSPDPDKGGKTTSSLDSDITENDRPQHEENGHAPTATGRKKAWTELSASVHLQLPMDQARPGQTNLAPTETVFRLQAFVSILCASIATASILVSSSLLLVPTLESYVYVPPPRVLGSTEPHLVRHQGRSKERQHGSLRKQSMSTQTTDMLHFLPWQILYDSKTINRTF